jgi:hypothetical protein
MLDDEQLISAVTARAIACDCKLIPVVLGSEGEPLDVGRAQRSALLGIRRALVARDRGCSFPAAVTVHRDCARPTTSSTGPTAALPPFRTRDLASCITWTPAC